MGVYNEKKCDLSCEEDDCREDSIVAGRATGFWGAKNENANCRRFSRKTNISPGNCEPRRFYPPYLQLEHLNGESLLRSHPITPHSEVMHDVLTIPEILASVFGLLDKACNARNARVCKTWKEPALDIVWSEGRPKVFRSLAPTEVTKTGGTKYLVCMISHSAPFEELTSKSTTRIVLDFYSPFDRERLATIFVEQRASPKMEGV